MLNAVRRVGLCDRIQILYWHDIPLSTLEEEEEEKKVENENVDYVNSRMCTRGN